MKIGKITKLFSLILISSITEASGQNNPTIEKESLLEIPDTQITETTSEKCIKSMNYTLALIKAQGGFEVVIMDGQDEVFYQNYPARITVRGEDTISMGYYAEKDYANAYKNVYREKYGFRAVAEIITDNGSAFLVEDKYSLRNGAFIIFRNVKVGIAKKNGYRFCQYSFIRPQTKLIKYYRF